MAAAHVTVQPGTVEGGGYAVVALRVPNERDDASTTRVRVLLPEDQPLASLQTTPVPGWRVSTRTRELGDPVDLHGSELSTVVSEVTWSATGTGWAPASSRTSSSASGRCWSRASSCSRPCRPTRRGERVDWNQVAVDDSVEPERPAPVPTLTAPTAAAEPTRAAAEADAGDTGGGSTSVLPVALAGAALVVALAALGLAWSTRRRPSAA